MLVSFCSAIHNRAWMLPELLDSMKALHGDWEWVVVDFDSSDNPWDSLIDQRVKFVQITSGFWKTKGLNLAAELAEGDIFFFLDVDLLLPSDFIKRIIKHTFTGQAYFPIKYNLHPGKPREFDGSSRNYQMANGHWFANGPGDCGFTPEDFYSLGRWNESFRYWGGEDSEMLKVCYKTLKVYRENVMGMFHRWHPRSNWYRQGKAFWRKKHKEEAHRKMLELNQNPT